MDSYSFYKSIYDRELNRRKDLDNSLNIPVTILTLIVGINSIFLDKNRITQFYKTIEIVNITLVLIGLSSIISIFFLIKFYNNWFKGFSYRNLAYTQEIRNFETVLIPEHNSQVQDKDKLTFETELITRLNSVTDNHITLNDQRSLDLYRAKTFIVLTLILTGIQLVILTFK